MIVFVKQKLVRTLLLFSLIFIFTLCVDDPTSIGDNLIPDDDKIKVNTLDSFDDDFGQTFSTFQKDSLYFGTSRRILLGNYQNLSIEMLIGFGIILPDSIATQLEANEVSLTNSWIEMKPNYWIGDSTQLSFSVHRIFESWSSVEFDDDTLSAIKSTMSGDVLLQNSYEFTDSVITVQIDQSIVNDWVMSLIDETIPENNGILFSPISNTGIVGFEALNAFPLNEYVTLKMIFEKSSGSSIDTISAIPNIDIHTVSSNLPIDPIGSSILQSSSSVRGNLKFDVSKVPADAIINSATLELFIDEANTIQGTSITDTVAISYYELNDGELEANDDYGLVPLFDGEKSYSGDLRIFVQRWVNGEPNEGMKVMLSDENRSASTIAFYNREPADSLSPRLTIHYTTQE